MTVAEARRAAYSDGVLIETENRFYSADVPEGRILSQLPPPGTKVRRGWKIRVAESLGPQRVAIPNVVGQSQRAAEINLGQRGLQLGSVATLHLPDIPPEQIVAQSPPPNAAGVTSPKVNLLISARDEDKAASYVMPDFVGRSLGLASAAVVKGGFRLGTVTVSPNAMNPVPPDKAPKLKPLPTDTVVAQTPAAGQKIVAGSSIDFQLTREGLQVTH